MKALTICQPYATLIAQGVKRVENRRWATSYRGPLAIHAGKSREWLSLSDDGLSDEDTGLLLAQMSFGAIVAIAQLIDVRPISDVLARRLPAELGWLVTREHTEGPFCWVLDTIISISPISVSGRQGLWDWTPPPELALPAYVRPSTLDQSVL